MADKTLEQLQREYAEARQIAMDHTIADAKRIDDAWLALLKAHGN